MYLDPGSGSMIIQIIIAAIAAGGTAFFALKARIKAWLQGRKGNQSADSAANVAQTDEEDGNEERQ